MLFALFGWWLQLYERMQAESAQHATAAAHVCIRPLLYDSLGRDYSSLPQVYACGTGGLDWRPQGSCSMNTCWATAMSVFECTAAYWNWRRLWPQLVMCHGLRPSEAWLGCRRQPLLRENCEKSRRKSLSFRFVPCAIRQPFSLCFGGVVLTCGFITSQSVESHECTHPKSQITCIVLLHTSQLRN